MFYIVDVCYSIYADSYSIATLKKKTKLAILLCYECNKNVVTSHFGSLKATIMHLITYDILC